MIIYSKDIDFVTDLLEMLSCHSSPFSENMEEWWEDNWYWEDTSKTLDDFCDEFDTSIDRLREISKAIKKVMGDDDSALYIDEKAIETGLALD